ncbi:hypothetical protein GF351_02900 [Candidatus Woesearchaeota archaeon]|nr:hypothetical protein [Candidatus Woesearchaeota archaeon]
MNKIMTVIIIASLILMAGCETSSTIPEPSPDEQDETQLPEDDQDKQEDDEGMEGDAGQEDPEPQTTENQETTEQDTETDEDAAEDQQESFAMDYEACGFITQEEIESFVGKELPIRVVEKNTPDGCIVKFNAAQGKYTAYLSVKDFSGSEETALQRIVKACPEIAEQSADELQKELGEISCRRIYRMITEQRDFFYVKNNCLIQVGTDMTDVELDTLKEIAELADPRICE